MRAFATILALSLAATAAAEESSSATAKLRFFGDWRARLETDWDSRDAAGVERDDRTRLRARVRVGLRYRRSERLSFELRARSGSDESHQSPHVTLLDFDDNDTGSADANLDRWFVRGEARDGKLWGWFGRNGLPYEGPGELVWDADATVVGLAGGWRAALGRRTGLRVHAGRFAAPVGMTRFTGDVLTLQTILEVRRAGRSFEAALGRIGIEARAGDPDAVFLLDGNGLRDYAIFTLDATARLPLRGRTLSVGLHGIHNAEDYSATDPDPVTAAAFDRTDGGALTLAWGDSGSRGAWAVGYTYASIEKLAVAASWAQDDWVRWGGADETRGSGFEGHELRWAVGVGARSNITARLFVVEADAGPEDGKRLRVDYNGRF